MIFWGHPIDTSWYHSQNVQVFEPKHEIKIQIWSGTPLLHLTTHLKKIAPFLQDLVFVGFRAPNAQEKTSNKEHDWSTDELEAETSS